MVENQDGLRDSSEFLDSVKVDLFRDEVFVFTPNGDLRALRRGATPLDFAFAIHTEVGHHCVGARVNGQQVPLRTELKNGDRVEILTSKTQRPSGDWIDIVATSRARNKIRSYLRSEQRKQSRHVGQEMLEKALRRYGVSFGKMQKSGELSRAASSLRFGNQDDLLAAVGYGKANIEDVVEHLLPDEKKQIPPEPVRESRLEKVIRKVKGGDDGIVIDGVDSLLVRFARCCNPLPGEEIIGYVSRGRGVVIHTRGCPKAAILDPDRQVRVQWSKKAVSQRPMRLKVTSTNRPGVLAALSQVFTDQNINIISAHCQVDGMDQGVNIFTFVAEDLVKLNQVIRVLKQSKGVLAVDRLHD
jgi:GTP pyrophosphokinase